MRSQVPPKTCRVYPPYTFNSDCGEQLQPTFIRTSDKSSGVYLLDFKTEKLAVTVIAVNRFIPTQKMLCAI